MDLLKGLIFLLSLRWVRWEGHNKVMEEGFTSTTTGAIRIGLSVMQCTGLSTETWEIWAGVMLKIY